MTGTKRADPNSYREALYLLTLPMVRSDIRTPPLGQNIELGAFVGINSRLSATPIVDKGVNRAGEQTVYLCLGDM